MPSFVCMLLALSLSSSSPSASMCWGLLRRVMARREKNNCGWPNRFLARLYFHPLGSTRPAVWVRAKNVFQLVARKQQIKSADKFSLGLRFHFVFRVRCHPHTLRPVSAADERMLSVHFHVQLVEHTLMANGMQRKGWMRMTNGCGMPPACRTIFNNATSRLELFIARPAGHLKTRQKVFN